jgi:cyanophycin synthetase
VIPDEQEAIDAGLGMSEAGDLLLIFADALVRSWKQVIKFKPNGVPETRAPENTPAPQSQPAVPVEAAFIPSEWDGVVRDERGIHLSREQDD